MSTMFREYLYGLCGREEWSDCTVVFYCRQTSVSEPAESRNEPGVIAHVAANFHPEHSPGTDVEILAVTSSSSGPTGKRQKASDGQPAKTQPESAAEQPTPRRGVAITSDVPVGDPLPAHLVVLCGGSPRFSAQASRWTQEQSLGSKPVLRVPLEDPSELPYALSAVRFIYTGKLDISGAAALLGLCQMASYLQVGGCVEACHVALSALVGGNSGGAAAPGGDELAGVVELYNSRRLLPDAPDQRAAVQALLSICRQQLVKHSAAYDSRKAGVPPEGGPSLGELLAWAFGDAPSILSDASVQQQMEALPAPAMEALLGCEHFATDEEATVLLMLARWLEVNATTTTDPTRLRLCKLLRLSQLSSTYLHGLVPLLSWLPVTADEHRFLCQYAAAVCGAMRTSIAAAADSKYDCTAPWYSPAVRPVPQPPSAVRSYDWSIDSDSLAKALAGREPIVKIDAAFHTAASVVAHGFQWHVSVEYEKGKDAAGAFLFCTLPAALRVGAEKLVAAVNPGPARLVVYRWRPNGTREEAWSLVFKDNVFVKVSRGWGEAVSLPLTLPEPVGPQQDQSGGTPAIDHLAPWAAYTQGGKIGGVLVLG